MSIVSITTEDKLISVDGDSRVSDYTFPSNLWAIQWDGATGHAEWTDGPNTDLTLDDVAGYITAWEAEAPPVEAAPTAQEVINNDSRMYLTLTDWYAIRKAEVSIAIPESVTTARAAARAAIVDA